MAMEWKDKVAVVTGGAHGIGKCVADELRKRGAKVAVIGDFAAHPRYQGAGSSMANARQVDDTLEEMINFFQTPSAFHRVLNAWTNGTMN